MMMKQKLTNTLRDNEKACIILQLPDHIILEIFSRIPINTLIQCKYVCKSWRRSLSDPDFTKSLFARTPAYLFLEDRSTLGRRSRNTRRRRLGLPPNKHILANLESLSSPNNMVLKLSDPNTLYNRLHSSHPGIMGSCNGFLCLQRCNRKTGAAIFNISNPITRECMPLPVNEETYFPLHYGFGFSPISHVYKVVVFADNNNNNNKRKRCHRLEVMVLIVGSGIWRRIGKIRDTVHAGAGVFHEGRLHWVSMCKPYGSHLIRAFDVETERFKDLPVPPHSFGDSLIKPQMGVLGGSLSVNDGWTFWVMKEYGKASWIKVLEIERDTVRFTIRGYTNWVEVLKFMEERKVLLLIGGKLWLYTPETKTLVGVEFDGMPSEHLSFVVDHIPSFVSPKDIINDYNSKVCS